MHRACLSALRHCCLESDWTTVLLDGQVLFEMKYNGQDADVWSCGVSLYVMLTGVFPFSRPTDEVCLSSPCPFR